MVGVPSAREEEHARLSGARGEFVASLPRRLDVLRVALQGLEQAPGSVERQHGLLRRLHALASSARVLGFTSVDEVLGEAERALRDLARSSGPQLLLREVARSLELLPALLSSHPGVLPGGNSAESGAESGYPLNVLVFGPQPLVSALSDADGASPMEIEGCDELERAVALARSLAPDAVLVDAEQRGARDLVERLVADSHRERFPLLVIGSFANPEAAGAYVTLGADRVLPKPVSPEMLRRALLDLHEIRTRPRGVREPVGELTVSALSERIAAEMKRGLVESLEPGGRSTRVDFGEGSDVLAAVWGAVARVRELTTVRSGGAVRFQSNGPEGAVPFAPWTEDRRAGERGARPGRGGEDVALQGRRILVADDDPAVVWFMTGLLRAVGAEVVEAHDGARALESVFESCPDVVVSDVLMPGRDGFALCHEIKRDVIARDVPVVLLSWKEDLLQRVRELGADADGYLRKEAAASTVVERLREVLRPRARVEQRLMAGGEARGRLDGITPRLVLDLVCRFSPDSTLTLRDAVYLYEVQVRSGSLRTVTRSASDGSFERGPSVLASLLGVNAGRFVVQPDTTPCRAEFHAPLAALLEEPVRKARAALAAVSAQALSSVTAVRVDLAVAGRYVDCSPQAVRQLVERLNAGESPRDLLLGGVMSPRLLEALLSDLARRGAIVSVERQERADGRSRAKEVTPAQAANEPPLRDRRAAPPPAQSEAGFSSASASAPAGLALEASRERVSDARVSSAGLEPVDSLAPVPTGASEPEAADTGWFSFQLDPSASGGVPPVAPRAVPTPEAPETAVEPTLSPTAKRSRGATLSGGITAPRDRFEDEESTSVFAALSEETFGPAPAKRDVGSGEAQPRWGEAPAESGPASLLRSGRRPSLQVPDSFDGPSPSMADVFAAALASAPDAGPSPRSDGEVAQASEEGPLALDREAESSPELERAARRNEDATLLHGPATLRGLHDLPVPGEASSEPPPAAASDASELDAPHDTSELDAPHDTSELDASHDTSELDASHDTSELDASHDTSEVDIQSRAASKLEATLLSESEPPRQGPSERPAAVQSRVAPQPASASFPQPERQDASSRARQAVGSASKPQAASSGESASVVRTLMLALLAFGVAFGVVRWGIVPALAPEEVAEPSPSPSAMVAAALGPALSAQTQGVIVTPGAAFQAGPRSLQLRSEDLPLPEGIALGADSALIEFAAEANDKLYVNDLLVGPGPRRPVPVPPGKHQVKIARGEQVGSLRVEVAKGRRARVSTGAEAAVTTP